MDVTMLQDARNESINGGRTTQDFLAGATYQVPDEIAQVWIGLGWAEAEASAAGEMSGTIESRAAEPVSPVAPVSQTEGKE